MDMLQVTWAQVSDDLNKIFKKFSIMKLELRMP